MHRDDAGSVALRQVSPSEWASTEVLGYGSSYDVVADGKDAKGRTTEAKFTLTTIAPATTAYANLIPRPARCAVPVSVSASRSSSSSPTR
ncbi:MAG: Ig-like domain-containing protein [Sciscionella sp.]